MGVRGGYAVDLIGCDQFLNFNHALIEKLATEGANNNDVWCLPFKTYHSTPNLVGV